MQPQYLNDAQGSVYNRGSVTSPSVTVSNGFSVANEGTIDFLGRVNVSGSAELRNLVDGTVTFHDGFSPGGGAVVTNFGTLSSPRGANLNSGSTVVNAGTATFGATVNVNGVFTNSGVVTIAGRLTANGVHACRTRARFGRRASQTTRRISTTRV